MYDKFDSPTTSDQQVVIEEEGIGSKLGGAVGPLRQHLKPIIALIVIAVIAWFAYDYFIGSVLPVSIRIEDTEGSSLEASLKVFAEGSDSPVFTGSGQSSYDLSLKPGSYRFEAKASEGGFLDYKKTLSVGPDTETPPITLSKNIKVEIVGFESAFPGRLFVGQDAQVAVQLKNNGTNTVQAELVPEGDLKSIATGGAVTLMPNGTGEALLNISVPDNTAVKDKTKGDSKTAQVRIKFTGEGKKASFTLLPNPTTGIELSGATLSAKALELKNKATATITVNNKNGFPLDDLSLSVEITTSTANNPGEVLRWFKFSEIADRQQPWAMSLDVIAAKARVQKELLVEVPLTAKKETNIKGNIVLNAPSLPAPIKKILTLNITEEASYSIQLTTAPKSPYNVEWDSTSGRYEKKTGTLNVKNSGQMKIENIFISVANDTECTTDWLTLLENSVESLAVGQTAQLKFNATAPIVARGNESPMNCDIHYRYDNPVNLGDYAEGTEPQLIQVTPKP